MEKLLLVMALLGSAHLAFRGLGKAGKLVFALAMPKPVPPGTVPRVGCGADGYPQGWRGRLVAV
jgi:hypothetical protein